MQRRKIVVNPIINWTTDEIWQYIKDNDISVNPLYALGYTRVGCVGCPMCKKSEKRAFVTAYGGKYYRMYLWAFEKMLKAPEKSPRTWKIAQDVMDWWLRL